MKRSVWNCYSKTLGALFVATSLAACGASTAHQHTLQPGVVAAVNGTVADSIIPVDQLSVPDESSPVLSQGPFLVPVLSIALLNSTKDGIAQRRIQPLKDQIVDVDFRAAYGEALRSTLGKVGWLKLRSLQQHDAAAATVDSRNARLQITTGQSLSSQASVMFVQSSLLFYPAGAAVDSPAAELRILYRSEEIRPERLNRAVSRWAQNRGEAYRSVLAEGIAESMKMTTMALAHMAGTRYSGTSEALLVWLGGEPADGGTSMLEPNPISGTVVEETPTRLILAVGTSEFLSLPKSAIGSRDVTGRTSGVPWHAPTTAPAGARPRPAPAATPDPSPAALPEPTPAPAPAETPAPAPG